LQAQFRNDGIAIQWRVGGTGAWTDIVNLVDITGPVARIGAGTGVAVDSTDITHPVISLGAPADVRGYLDTASYVASRTVLKALDTTKDTTAYLTESGREGTFVFRSGDYSALVAADTSEINFIAADDAASTSGAWVRAQPRDTIGVMVRVRAVATSNVALSTGLAAGQVVDGVTLAVNDLVLLGGQTTLSENGIYTVPASGAASRTTAFNTYDSMPGVYISVMEGTSYADRLWRCTSDKGGTLDTDDLVFESSVDLQTLNFGDVTGVSINIQRPNLDGVATATLISVGQGVLFAETTRTSGTGQYGNVLVHSIIDTATGVGEFDVGITAWSTNYNLTGGQVFGMWAGANTPSNALGETYTGGAAVGMEINAGNRWADFGLLSDVGATRYTVGLQVAPDVLPANDGATAAIYPGSFGIVITPSNSGHKWWTGKLVRTDAIMAGGYVNRDNGGSVVGNAPLAHTKVSGYFTDGLDFTGATISGKAFKSYGFSIASSGAIELGVIGSTLGQIYLDGSTSGQTILQPSAAASGTLTLPAATDTLVGKATTDTLTNKTFDTAGTGNVLKVNGTAISDKTGTGKVVLDTSPTLSSPTLGVASATSLALTGTGTANNRLDLSTTNTVGIYTGGHLTATYTSDASAVNYLQVTAKNTGTGPFFIGNGSDTDVSLNFGSKGAGSISFYTDTLSTFPVQFQVAHTAGATNWLGATGSNAGAPSLLVLGASTNADLKLVPKGTGVLQVGNSASMSANGAVATTMTSLGPTGSHTTIQEWLTIKNASGTVRYIPCY